MGDQLTAPVYDPVDEEAYPRRTDAEAQEGVEQLLPHDEESRARSIFVKQVVDEGGEVSFELTDEAKARGFKSIAEVPHLDYVENPDANPGYRPPVYEQEAPVTAGGIPVEDIDYSTWRLAELKTEVEERQAQGADIDDSEARSKADYIDLLEADDEAGADGE